MEIEVKNLTKYFGDAKVLDNLNFSIDRGEIIGFLGPNGAGKTTTMRILTCFLAPTKGEVKISNLDILNDSLAIRQKIGYLPENNPVYSDLRVYEYLEFIAQAKNISGWQPEIARVIKLCGLQDRIAQPINELSKGFRQRVGLAQALLGNPEIIILDEPTSGLDPNQIIEIRNLIKEIGKTKTVILSTHILNEVQATCTRVIIIDKGKIVASGTTNDLIKQAQGKSQIKVAIAGDAGRIQAALSGIAGVENVSKAYSPRPDEHAFVMETAGGSDPRKKIFEMCVANNWSLLELEHKTISLEDVFTKLTKS